MNDTDWVDGNTIPQLMTHGAGDYTQFVTQFYVFFYTLGPFESDVWKMVITGLAVVQFLIVNFQKLTLN